jgi:hypothetical protein
MNSLKTETVVVHAARALSDMDENDVAAAIAQAKAHFIEMPGLTLTLAQAARLWALHPALCRDVIAALVEAGFLVRVRDASFARS